VNLRSRCWTPLFKNIDAGATAGHFGGEFVAENEGPVGNKMLAFCIVFVVMQDPLTRKYHAAAGRNQHHAGCNSVLGLGARCGIVSCHHGVRRLSIVVPSAGIPIEAERNCPENAFAIRLARNPSNVHHRPLSADMPRATPAQS